MIVRYLNRDGYTTLEAGDGEEARRLIETGNPSLVVLDLMLPGVDGLELCRWIRNRSDLPVIMLTATKGVTVKITANSPPASLKPNQITQRNTASNVGIVSASGIK